MSSNDETSINKHLIEFSLLENEKMKAKIVDFDSGWRILHSFFAGDEDAADGDTAFALIECQHAGITRGPDGKHQFLVNAEVLLASERNISRTVCGAIPVDFGRPTPGEFYFALLDRCGGKSDWDLRKLIDACDAATLVNRGHEPNMRCWDGREEPVIVAEIG